MSEDNNFTTEDDSWLQADEQERTPRSVEGREATKRPGGSWLPASVLPTPEPEDGWVFRWVRTSTLGNSDNTNEGNIEIGGLLLCKAPEEEMRQRAAYYRDVASQQMESVDNSFMRENDPRMPLLKPERNTRTTFGRS